jgi:hypoxanthine phosphoribosyltransferase
VEDIVDTGKTIVALVDELKKFEPRTLKVASLLIKKTSASNGFKPDCNVFFLVR